MAAITFDDLVVNDALETVTLERAVATYAAYAGLHDHRFDALIDEAFATLAAWTIAAGTWEASGSAVYATGDPAGYDWDTMYYSGDSDLTECRDGYLTLTKYDARGGVTFRGSTDQAYFLAYWTATAVGFARVVGTAVTTLAELPEAYPGQAEIGVAFREMRHSSLEDDYWLHMSLYIDGQHVLASAYQIDESTPPGTDVGLAVYGTDAGVKYASLTLPELHDVVEWCSLDVAETPAAGLGRVIGQRDVILRTRWDGTLAASRPKAQAVDYTFDDDNCVRRQRTIDNRQVVTHLRQEGAFDDADLFDEDLAAAHGHRFQLDHNPYLLNTQACAREGVRTMQKAAAEAETVQLEGPYQPLLEVEDRIATPYDDDAVVDNIGTTLNAAEAAMRVAGRKYTYET